MAARQHDHILDVARTLVADAGYDATTMEGIALKAGVGKPTLYRWWPNRAALVHEAIVENVARTPFPDTGSLRGDLHGFVAGAVEFFEEPLVREAWLGCIAELRAGGAIEEANARFLQPAADQLRQRLRAAVRRGEARPDADPQVVLDVLLGACIAGLIVPGKRPVRAKRVDAVVELVLRGVSSSGRAG